jgi:hypothetical protein
VGGSYLNHLTSSFAAMDETAFWAVVGAVYTHRRGMNLHCLKGMTYLEVINDEYDDFTLSLDEVECVVRNKDGQRERLSPDFLLQKIDLVISGTEITRDAVGVSYNVYSAEIIIQLGIELDYIELEYGSDTEANDYRMSMSLCYRNPPT